jgi:hypothetical protein
MSDEHSKKIKDGRARNAGLRAKERDQAARAAWWLENGVAAAGNRKRTLAGRHGVVECRRDITPADLP